jgi:hypothetical protein
MVNRRCSPPDGPGITISERGCGFAEASIEPRVVPRVLLSLLLSSKVCALSPLTAGLLVKPPAGLAEALDSGSGLAIGLSGCGASVACTAILFGVCILFGGSVLFGGSCSCEPGPGMLSPSLQFAGVSGTGPKAAIPPGGGRRVGGDTIGSFPVGIR